MKVINNNPIKYMYGIRLESFIPILINSNLIENLATSIDERAIRLTCGIEIFTTYDSMRDEDEGDIWYYPDRYITSLPIPTGELAIRDKINNYQ